jgi:hypothetical protein
MTNAPSGDAIMASTEMADTTVHTDLGRPSPRRAWAVVLESRERRWWAAALVATLVVGATAIGMLYADDSRNQAALRSLQTSNESLTGRNLILNDQLNATQTNLTATLGELAKTKAQLAHPQLVTWNTPAQIKDNTYYLASGVPDTFTFHLQATSSGPMSVSILTIEEFAAGVNCVRNGVAVTNWCMHHQGTVISWIGQTSVNYDFHDAEGCADYLAVFTATSAVTVTPNISVTYNPASKPTGACA